MAADTIMGPVHPGEILLEEFLKPLSVSQYHLAKEIGVPARRVNEIVHGQRRISADTALRLARFSVPRSGSGSTCSRATTWRWKRTGWAMRLTVSAHLRPLADSQVCLHRAAIPGR
jgi:addiction module HigA family antidote